MIIIVFTTIFTQAQQQFFEYHTFKRGGIELPYRLEKPENYSDDDTTVYPVILFLHGAGERGNDNEAQITYIDKIFGSDTFRSQYPFFVVVPQCPENKRWVEVDWGLPSHIIPDTMSETMNAAMLLLVSILHRYHIDTNRIYVVGLSMGGYGVWDIIARFPNLFAAAVPICGGGDEHTAEKIAHIPIWAYHGTRDRVVPVERSRNMIAAIKQAGGNPRYTEVPNKGHLVWNTAFENPELWKWLFEQKKK